MTTVSAIISEDLNSRIEEETQNTNKSKSQIIREGIETYFEDPKQDQTEFIKEKEKQIKQLKETIRSKEENIEEVKENRRTAIRDKEDKIEMLQEQIQNKQDQIKELQSHIQELQEEKENTATFGEWVTSINPLARFFIKAGLMMAGWKIPERVKENTNQE